jgi:Na+/glutamate symporter
MDSTIFISEEEFPFTGQRQWRNKTTNESCCYRLLIIMLGVFMALALMTVFLCRIEESDACPVIVYALIVASVCSTLMGPFLIWRLIHRR